MKRSRFLGLISAVLLLSMQKTVAQNGDTWYVKRCLHALNEVLIHDITSPPVASRNYVYAFVAFYEAVRPGSPGFRSAK